MASSDMHEFQLIDDGKTALMTVYQQRQFDMSPWNIITGIGWVMESIFQEVDVETGQVLFEWRSLDHVDPSLSYTLPDHTDTSGTGLDPSSPWDYFHINSIDKNAEGDYLISSRHTSAVYKISGKDGSIMWRLNGQNPSFTNENFDFSQQHDARWLFENTTHTMLSLYNNGYNGFNQTHEFSSGMIILIDYEEKKATQVRDYVPPGKEMLSSSQGNMQLLPGYNVFMGWGSNAYVSEHDFDGNLVLWGYFSKDPGFMNYRAQKFKWEGNPTDAPALWSFSKSTEPYSPTTFYASWNGATRVKYWRFYGSMNATGPYTLLNQVLKTGFETAYTELNYYPWTHVEAVGAKGKTLGKSTNRFTFVPSPEVQGHCTDESCGNAATYGFPDEANPNPRPLIPPMGVSTVPWVDPENPDKLFDWGQSGGLYNQPEEEGEEEPSYSGSVYGMFLFDFYLDRGENPILMSILLCNRLYQLGRRSCGHARGGHWLTSGGSSVPQSAADTCSHPTTRVAGDSAGCNGRTSRTGRTRSGGRGGGAGSKVVRVQRRQTAIVAVADQRVTVFRLVIL